MMDYGSIVPLRRAANLGPALFVYHRPVEYMRLWKSQDSEPFLFPYSEYPIDLTKAAVSGTEPTQVATPGLRQMPRTGTGVSPHAPTHVSMARPATAEQRHAEQINVAHPKPAHLQTDEHRLAHVKGVLWGAASRMAGIERKAVEGGGGLSSGEAQDFSKLRGLRDRMTKVSDALERAGVKDLPQHHQDLQHYWQHNPGARSGAVGGKLHLDANTMHIVHGNLASAQPSGPAPKRTPGVLNPVPTTGPRGKTAAPDITPPELTTAGGTHLPLQTQATVIPAHSAEPTKISKVPSSPTLAPLPALGGGATHEELGMPKPTAAAGTVGAVPSKKLKRSLAMLVDMLKAFAPSFG